MWSLNSNGCNSNEWKRDYEFGGDKQKQVLQGNDNDIFGHLGATIGDGVASKSIMQKKT